MGLVDVFPSILNEIKVQYGRIIDEDHSGRFALIEIAGSKKSDSSIPDNMLARGDSLNFIKYLLDDKKLGGKINCIYIDPPFFSRSQYGAEFKLKSEKIEKIPAIKQKAYSDTWENGMEEYLKMVGVRLMLMRDLLSDEGSIVVHLDWHAVHYVKVLMDEIFGEKNFVNEIIWHYKSGGAGKRRFARKHDTLLLYGKTDNYYFLPLKEKSYNRGYRPYRFKGVKEYKDELGWYTMVNRKDVWNIDMVGRTSKERTGYVTQKPETLIERVLESCTKEGDICADFFGGAGTLAATAEKMKRKWISCDIGRLATVNSHKRMINLGSRYGLYCETFDKGDKSGQGSIRADVRIEKDIISDKLMLSVEIKGYEIGSFEDIPIDKKYLAIVRKIMKEDPLQFIAYWSVDHNYMDGINRPAAYMSKNSGEMSMVYETLAEDIGVIYIKAVDIFGNEIGLMIDKNGGSGS